MGLDGLLGTGGGFEATFALLLALVVLFVVDKFTADAALFKDCVDVIVMLGCCF